MRRDEVMPRVLCVLERCTGMGAEQLGALDPDEPLTGAAWNLSPTDLVYILFELEKEFGLRFPAEVLENYGLGTAGSICESVCRLTA